MTHSAAHCPPALCRLTEQWVAAGDCEAELVAALRTALASLPAANLATLRIIMETCYRECTRATALVDQHDDASATNVYCQCLRQWRQERVVFKLEYRIAFHRAVHPG